MGDEKRLYFTPKLVSKNFRLRPLHRIKKIRVRVIILNNDIEEMAFLVETRVGFGEKRGLGVFGCKVIAENKTLLRQEAVKSLDQL